MSPKKQQGYENEDKLFKNKYPAKDFELISNHQVLFTVKKWGFFWGSEPEDSKQKLSNLGVYIEDVG